MPTIKQNDSFYTKLIYIVSVVVFLLVSILPRLPKPDPQSLPSFVFDLPALNAFLNGTTTILLLISFYFIRKKDIQMHKKLNLAACSLSTIFLLSYVAYHGLVGEQRFPADHPMRTVYLIILATHIILAAIVLPMVLLSLYRGLTNQVSKHKKITRWSYPIWLYVTITGVIVYLMISPHYKF